MLFLLATRNKGKLREFQSALRGLPIGLQSLLEGAHLPEPEERGRSFAENARLKAEHYHRLTGVPALADDSGLQVEALAGAPGVCSSRFAPTDPERLRKLLEQMAAFPEAERRAARFVCALCLVAPHRIIEVEGRVEGRIAARPQGRRGFGYDPLFYYPPLGKTFAQMSLAEKNRVSHRARALRRLRARLGETEWD